MPKSLEAKLDSLTELKEEISGVLLYREENNACFVEGVFLTGGGSAGSVKPDQNRVHTINEFLRENPEYGYIEFHTHSQGTIQAYGEQFARTFSREDIRAIQNKFERDGRYMHLLVTPEAQLLCGADQPDLISKGPGHPEHEQAIGEALSNISERMGYDVVA